MKKEKIPRANRKISRFSWIEFLSLFFAMSILSALPGIMYGDRSIFDVIGDYLLWYLLYWALITALICIFTAYQKYRSFDVPMNRLSSATKKVAEGDFSVYLKPIHTSDKADYVDNMFQDFNRMVKELGSLETMKTDFVSSVSHEIKTPLAIIQNYASALQNTQLSDQQREEYLQTIIHASKNLSSLVTNILTLNKLENQGIYLPSEPYDICRQLAESILSFEGILNQKQLELVVDIEDRALVLADENLIDLVWRNLLSNAMKFSLPGGTITIKQTSTEDEIIVTISDTGEGMSEETQRRLFEKFYQGDSSHSREGNGLGMALVARIIAMVNGQISVSSLLDQGTTFTVTLPAASFLSS